MSSNSPWEIKDATPNDIDLIRSLCLRIWPATYSQILSSEQMDYMLDWMYSPASLAKQMEDGARFILLYYKDHDVDGTELTSKPVGYASFQWLRDNHYKLHKLYLLPELQGLGGGRYFMGQILQKVKDADGHSIELQVNRSNKAVGFYKQLGFRVIKVDDFAIGNGYYMNDFIMQIDLIQ